MSVVSVPPLDSAADIPDTVPYMSADEATSLLLQLLREDWKRHDGRIEALEQRGVADQIKDAKPIDISALMLTPKVFVAAVVFIVGIAGSNWAANAGLRSDMRDLLTKMEAQKSDYAATMKLEEERMATIRQAIDDVKKQQQLQALQLADLNNKVAAIQAKGVLR